MESLRLPHGVGDLEKLNEENAVYLSKALQVPRQELKNSLMLRIVQKIHLVVYENTDIVMVLKA